MGLRSDLPREKSVLPFFRPGLDKGLTGVEEVRKLWFDMKRRCNFAQMSDSMRQLPYIARDGKTYQIDFTDDKGLYLIAQHLRVTKERPVLSEIKHFLARAGVFADKARRDPEAAAAEFQRVANENEYHKMRA